MRIVIHTTVDVPESFNLLTSEDIERLLEESSIQIEKLVDNRLTIATARNTSAVASFLIVREDTDEIKTEDRTDNPDGIRGDQP